MSAFKLGRRNPFPKVIFIAGLVLAAVAVALWLLFLMGVRFR